MGVGSTEEEEGYIKSANASYSTASYFINLNSKVKKYEYAKHR